MFFSLVSLEENRYFSTVLHFLTVCWKSFRLVNIFVTFSVSQKVDGQVFSSKTYHSRYLKSSLLNEVRNLIQDNDFDSSSEEDSENESQPQTNSSHKKLLKIDVSQLKLEFEIKTVENINTPTFFIRPDKQDTDYTNYMKRVK
jgi:hypothetical protein